jgi:hypothetical protein
MPSLGLVTGSGRAGHQTLRGKPMSALRENVSIRVLTEAVRLRVWPKFVPAVAGIEGLQVFESSEVGRCVWMGPLRRT